MSVPLTPASLLGGLVSWPFRQAARIGLAAVGGWIVTGAEAMLHEVVALIGLVSTPALSASWFSPTYWRITGLALVLTLPFLFAAAIQAVVRTDLGVLTRAAFVHLPVAVLAASVTAPLMQLALAATDQLCLWVTGGGGVDAGFLDHTALVMNGLGTGVMTVVIALVILLAGFCLLIELIMRAAAIYIVVLFLPLGFAAMVWPARRVWLTRMLETLAALVISKFVMVAILAVAVDGVASFIAGAGSLATALTATALLVLSAFSPWVLLRLLPFTELAAAAAGSLWRETRAGHQRGREQLDHARALPDRARERVHAGLDALEHLVRSVTGEDPWPDAGNPSRRSPASPGFLAVGSGPGGIAGGGDVDPHDPGGPAPGRGSGPGVPPEPAPLPLPLPPAGATRPPNPPDPARGEPPAERPTPRRPSLEEEMPLLHPDNAGVVIDLAGLPGSPWLEGLRGTGPSSEEACAGTRGAAPATAEAATASPGPATGNRDV